jgi:predicted DNA-binding antitoxin AbrB/MazE fold protein
LKLSKTRSAAKSNGVKMESIRVKYEDGVFKPLKRLRKLKEGAIGEVYLDEAQIERTRKRTSMRSSEFFGLWKNRRDMGDGVSYVRALRSKSRYQTAGFLIDTDVLIDNLPRER